MEATLSAYQPTWRDKLARALMGDGRASPARRTLVEGLMGSSGLGTTGMGLVDATPAGIPLAAQEARNDAMNGNMVGATLGAMAVMPAAKPVARAAQTGIRAYHGSPHDFDKFDLSKIGTGEGAQAYGHGLYFAENEAVAKGYRDTLIADRTQPAQRLLNKHGGDIDAAMEAAKAEIARLQGLNLTPETGLDRARSMIETQENNLAALSAMKSGGAPRGSMYEVNIRANPDDFLDWDKPLTEQSKAAEALKPIIGNVSNPGYGVGPALKDAKKYMNMADDPRGPEQLLREAGIPGIKYLDQGSRAAGDGSRNYVVFDDNLIEILRKYGLTGLLGLGAVGGAYQNQTQEGGS